jgi:hypothetical protein
MPPNYNPDTQRDVISGPPALVRSSASNFLILSRSDKLCRKMTERSNALFGWVALAHRAMMIEVVA